ncbi:hypothetical protein ABPG77_004409 [Micractinium sp. CCAP 211/92]
MSGIASRLGSTAPSEAGELGEPVCRVCWEPGGRIACPCACTTGIHDHCLVQWLLTANERPEEVADSCELCMQRWQGEVTVPIQDLLEHVAALKRSQVGAAELSTAVDTLRQRNEQLLQLLQAAGEAEAARQADFARMRRIAAADRQAILGRLEEERQWRRSNLRFLPQLLLALTGAFLAGWQRGASRHAGK